LLKLLQLYLLQSAMLADLLVFACLLFAGHARRVQVSREPSQDHRIAFEVVDDAPNSLKSLARILQVFKPAEAFTSSGPGRGHPMGNPAHKIQRPTLTGRQGNSVMKKVYENTLFSFLPRPEYLDDTYAADAGFDPLGLVMMDGPWWNVPCASTPKRRLAWMREAEVKHSRLAMLAAAGWPLSELWNAKIADWFELPYGLEVTGGRAPSVLNGNLLSAYPILIVFLLVIVWLEVKTLDQVHGLTATGKTRLGDNIVEMTYTPGDLGFDPLGLYSFFQVLGSDIQNMQSQDSDEYRVAMLKYNNKLMEAAEIRNGRLAMCAITYFAAVEAVTKTPIIDQTPILFTPLNELLFSGKY